MGTSAIESRKLGYLLESDVVVPNKDELLYVALQQARALYDAGLGGRKHRKVIDQVAEGDRVVTRVTATGDAALIIPAGDLACAPGPLERFGTDAAGWPVWLYGPAKGTKRTEPKKVHTAGRPSYSPTRM